MSDGKVSQQTERGDRMFDLPEVSDARLHREFELDELNAEVTSIDITAHGCFVAVGCSNGMLMLFDMASAGGTTPVRGGALLGHIQAKGLHTNLLLTVRISEDSRFIFAGVIKGSMEMLAVDIGKLPVWTDKTLRRSQAQAQIRSLVKVHTHSDPKLRGFGGCARLSESDSSGRGNHYRLVCGRGIKNVHIWLFSPDVYVPDGTVEGSSIGSWTCLYVVTSNGNTLETLAFRNNGQEVMSKSAGMSVRVWQVGKDVKDSRSSDEETDRDRERASGKLSYEDVPNTQDVRVLLNDLAFGGTYKFAVTNLKDPKQAKHDYYEVPELSAEDDQGQRRKRLMRLIDDIVTTQDGKHALALCTDGGVLYFRDDRVEKVADPKSLSDTGKGLESTHIIHCSLVELGNLQRDVEVAGPWALKRVGKQGTVVVLKSHHSPEDENPMHIRSIISVKPLTEDAAGEVKDTQLPAGAVPWNSYGYYYDNSSETEDVCRFSALSVDSKNDGEATTSKTAVRKSRSATPKVRGNNEDFITPAVPISGGHSRLQNISPHDNLMQIVHPDVGTPLNGRRSQDHAPVRRRRLASTDHSTDGETSLNKLFLSTPDVFVNLDEDKHPKKVKTLLLGPARKVQRIHETDTKSSPLRFKAIDSKVIAFSRITDNYQSNSFQFIRIPQLPCPMNDFIAKVVTSLKQILNEQGKVAAQFVEEVIRHIHFVFVSRSNSTMKKEQAEKCKLKLFKTYKSIADEMISRQNLELDSVMLIYRLANFSEKGPRSNLHEALTELATSSKLMRVSQDRFVASVSFLYSDMFDRADHFFDSVSSVFA